MPRISDDQFWDVIAVLDWDNADDIDAVLDPPIRALAQMSEDDIYSFADVLAEKLFAIDTREHARYAYEGELDVDNGDDYISADDFLYRRCVVVANGRAFYDSVLADPRKMQRNGPRTDAVFGEQRVRIEDWSRMGSRFAGLLRELPERGRMGAD